MSDAIKEVLRVYGGPQALAQYERESRESAAANWDAGYLAHKRGEQQHNPYREPQASPRICGLCGTDGPVVCHHQPEEQPAATSRAEYILAEDTRRGTV